MKNKIKNFGFSLIVMSTLGLILTACGSNGSSSNSEK